MIQWHLAVRHMENGEAVAGASVEFDPRSPGTARWAAELADETLAEIVPLNPKRQWWVYHTFPIPALVDAPKKKRWWEQDPLGTWFPEDVI